MSVFDWQTFLKDWNRAILTLSEVEHYNLPKQVIESGWLGFGAASEEQIRQAEAKLDTRLPPSYRAFLRVSNGWRNTGTFIDHILPVEQIYWFRDAKDRSLIKHAEMYMNQTKDVIFDPDYHEVDYSHFMDTLVIVRPSDEEELYLLNPKVKNDNGEWQAWIFGHWVPGAHAFVSFQALLEGEYKTILEDIMLTTKAVNLHGDKAKLIQKIDYLIKTTETQIKQATPDQSRADHPNYEDAVQYAKGMQEVLDRMIAIMQSNHDTNQIYQHLDSLVHYYQEKQQQDLSFSTRQEATDLINTLMDNKNIQDPDVLNLIKSKLQSSLHSSVVRGNMRVIDSLHYLLNS